MKQTHEKIKQIYDSFPADVDTKAVENGNKIQIAWHQEKLEAIAKTLKNAKLKRKSKILDLACGSGPLTIKLANLFPEFLFYGCDFNEKAIRIANERTKKEQIKNANFFACKAESICFKKKMFNAVIVLDGLDHFLDPKKALQEIHRVSKKEAILALAVGNYLSLWPALEIFWDKFGKGRKYLETHLTRFTKKTLANMVNSNGFHNVKITTIHNSRPFFSILTKKYSKKIEIFLSEYSLGMTLLLTAKK